MLAPHGAVFGSVRQFHLKALETRPGAISGGKWGTLAEFGNVSAATQAGPVTGGEPLQSPNNGGTDHHRRWAAGIVPARDTPNFRHRATLTTTGGGSGHFLTRLNSGSTATLLLFTKTRI